MVGRKAIGSSCQPQNGRKDVSGSSADFAYRFSCANFAVEPGGGEMVLDVKSLIYEYGDVSYGNGPTMRT